MEDTSKALSQDIDRGAALWWQKRTLLLVLIAGLLFTSAGTLRWDAGWRIVLLAVLGLVAEGLALPRALKADRSRVREGSKRWDAVYVRLIGIALYLGIFVTAGIDARLAITEPLSSVLVWAALVGWVLAYVLALRAMRQNPYFSRTVRIQEGHRVIDSGPYRRVRHPGYAASLLFLVTTPLLMESLLAFVPVGLAIIGLVARTAAEDRTLRRELDGYASYAARVRYRLIPALW